MTKIAQCGDCLGNGVHCEHYRPYDDSPCEHFQKSVDDEDKDESIPYYLFPLVFILLTLIFPVLPTVIFVLGGLLVLFIILLIRQYLNNKFLLKKMEKLLLKTIKKIGCQPVVEENHDISFAYQGENFVIRIMNEKFIAIWNFWWGTLPVDDPALPQLKNAINETNIRNLLTTFYSVNEEYGVVGLHTKYDTAFIPEIPELDNFLKYILDFFFDVHNEVKGRFQQLREEQEKVEKNSRVIVKGFSQDYKLSPVEQTVLYF